MINDYWEPPQAVTRSNILEWFDRKANLRTLSTGKRLERETIGQSKACILIERFVERVIANPKPAYDFKPYAGVHESLIGMRLREMVSLLGFFDADHDYSEHVSAFLQACWTIESMWGLNLQVIGHPDYYPEENTAEALNLIVDRIRMSAGESWFQRAAYDRRYEAALKSSNVERLTADILRYYARTMVVRVDLGYEKWVRRGLTIDAVYAHLDQFVAMMGSNPVFDTLVGYAWAIEQGERQGFHIHLSLFFNGSKEYKDVYKGFEVKAVWAAIVGQGAKTHICNAHLEDYEEGKIGIGLIDRRDTAMCLNAIEYIPYIAKETESQFLRIRPKGRRAYGSSLRPNFSLKRGRPASSLPEWEYPC